ncbi:MAG: PHB depolymerase family esterase [Verrucomicrobiota bacterium]
MNTLLLSKYILILATLISLGPASYGNTPQESFIEFGQYLRRYLYYIPQDLPNKKRPLVFVLHEEGKDAEYMMTQTTKNRWNQLADQEKFIVIYPQGIHQSWNLDAADSHQLSHADDVGFIDAILDLALEELAVDPQRIYVSGHSYGGMMSFHLALERSDRFAAVSSFAGALPIDSILKLPEFPISILYMAATSDASTPFHGGKFGGNRAAIAKPVLSAHDTIAYWVDHLETTVVPKVEHLPVHLNDDHGTVTKYVYSNGFDLSQVAYYQIEGHGRPSSNQFSPTGQSVLGKKNQEILVCDEIWAFFKEQKLAHNTLAPKPPKNLSYEETATLISLSWSPNTEEDFKAYRIFKAVNDGEFMCVVRHFNHTELIDDLIESGNTYSYYLRAMDEAGNQSGPSQTITIEIAE